MSLVDIGTRIENALGLDSSMKSSLQEPNSPYPLTVISFHHFITSSATTVGNPAIQKVMTGEMIQVAFNVGFYTPPIGLWKLKKVANKL